LRSECGDGAISARYLNERAFSDGLELEVVRIGIRFPNQIRRASRRGAVTLSTRLRESVNSMLWALCVLCGSPPHPDPETSRCGPMGFSNRFDLGARIRPADRYPDRRLPLPLTTLKFHLRTPRCIRARPS